MKIAIYTLVCCGLIGCSKSFVGTYALKSSYSSTYVQLKLDSSFVYGLKTCDSYNFVEGKTQIQGKQMVTNTYQQPEDKAFTLHETYDSTSPDVVIALKSEHGQPMSFMRCAIKLLESGQRPEYTYSLNKSENSIHFIPSDTTSVIFPQGWLSSYTNSEGVIRFEPRNGIDSIFAFCNSQVITSCAVADQRSNRFELILKSKPLLYLTNSTWILTKNKLLVDFGNTTLTLKKLPRPIDLKAIPRY